MKLFCSYAFTGENLQSVTDRMRLVVDQLNEAGHDAYCPLFDAHKDEMQANNDIKGIFSYAFRRIHENEGVVAIITSDRRSEGQLMEIGAALSQNKPVYLFVHDSAKDAPSHLRVLATQAFTWADDRELKRALSTL